MSDDAPHDPWDTLADSLGAKPAGTPPPAPKPVSPPPRRERPAARRPAPPPAAGDWDSLAADLGVQPRRDESTGRAATPRPVEPRPAAEPPAPRDRGQEPRRERRASFEEGLTQESAPPRRDQAEGERRERPARAEGEGSEAGGEGSGRRRRRGRRGGRGRRRGDDRGPAGESHGSGERQPIEREGDRGRRAASRLPRPADDASEGDAWRDDLEAADFDVGPRVSDGAEPAHDDGGRAPEGERPAGGDDRPRKRRRRGRRGGRVRGRGDDLAPRGDRGPRPRDDGDDEPLPASYGSRPVDRQEEGREDRVETETPAARKAEADDAPRGRGRRRRSRRGGDRRRETSGERPPRPAGRSERRRDEPRPSRGRRGDFEPVAGRYDEDDEGLEFLGVEEAARSASPRPRPAAEDDVLAESGLTGVLDVPSWVEAIGIVIAGNLAARSRSGRGDGGKGR